MCRRSVFVCLHEGVQLCVLGPTWQCCADSGAWAAGLGAGEGEVWEGCRGSTIASVPPDPDSRRQMDRPQPLPKGQRGHRGHRANGEGQPRLTQLTQRKKTHTVKHSHRWNIHKIQNWLQSIFSSFFNCKMFHYIHRETFTFIFIQWQQMIRTALFKTCGAQWIFSCSTNP